MNNTPQAAPHQATAMTPSVLARLRSLTPQGNICYHQARIIAEKQAVRLSRILGGDINETSLAALPRIRIVWENLPTSGLSYWNGTDWIIALSVNDHPARQRFTLLHEFKHIIDHGSTHRLYRTQCEAERAADYFAACALMPKTDLKRVFCTLTQDIAKLADHFGVSKEAIRVRLEQTGLVDPTSWPAGRCARPVATPWHEPQRFVPAR